MEVTPNASKPSKARSSASRSAAPETIWEDRSFAPRKPAAGLGRGNGLARSEEDRAFEAQMVAIAPVIRSFARGLCGDAAAGEDLAQEALLKAWLYRAQFTVGTNFKGWVLKIARNHFYSQRRRAWRETPLDDDMISQMPSSRADQIPALMLNDLRNALRTLSDEQRQAAVLVGAGGFTHRQAADLCDVPEGTMKSRVCRARARLTEVLDAGHVEYDEAPASHAAAMIMSELNLLARGRDADEA
ncbi:MAG: sigma-70 family RNA polymerase sigma factor [Caulobacter sp.]|nr:sigma-70 family RNA polymerase sigma factor [Caulobacter sp.]